MQENIKENWEGGKDFEVDFWHNWILTKGDKWPDDFSIRLDPTAPVSSFIAEHLVNINRVPKVLDVGAGPLSCVGKILPDGRKIELIAVDPLAEKYSASLKEACVEPLVKTLYAEVEKLDKIFEPNIFDLVYMRNALDHSYDSMLGIKQMLRAVKEGGFVILMHFTNEAETASYGAFHQWNICAENNDFILWNKTTKINVTNELKNIAKTRTNSTDTTTNVVIEKLAL